MLTKRVLNLVVSYFLVMLSGCSLLPQKDMYADYSVKPLVYNEGSAGNKLIAAIIKKSAADTESLVDLKCLNYPVVAGDTVTCQQQRNIAIMALLTASDNMCQEHVKSIFGNDASFNIITGTVTNIASGAAALAGGEAAKSAFASVAFLSNAERSLVNETVYKNMLVTAVTKKISEARTNTKASISAKFSADINTYPMLSSVNDILGYHETCAFMYGLQKALDEGVQPNLETKKVKLEQDKHDLEIYVQTRTTLITAAVAVSDEGVVGAKARIKAIEEELLSMVKAQN